MKIILLQNIKGFGKIGDVKSVSDGHAKNFLFPKNLAKVASLNYLGVIYALGFGYIFFQETFNMLSLVAIGIILLGVFLNLFDQKIFKNSKNNDKETTVS